MKKLAYVLLFISFIACSDNSTTPEEIPPIWPLEPGNYWLYESWGFTPDGLFTDSMRIDLTKDTLIQNETFYVLRSSPSDMKCYTYRGTNLYSVYNVNGKDIIDILLEYPGTVGKKFLSWGEYKRIISKDYVVATKNKKYTCYHYQFVDTFLDYSFTYNHYYSPGIGLVMEKVSVNDKDKKLIAESNLLLYEYYVKE